MPQRLATAARVLTGSGVKSCFEKTLDMPFLAYHGCSKLLNTLSAGGVYIRSRAPFPSPRSFCPSHGPALALVYIRSRIACLLPLTVRSGRLQAQDLQRQLFLDKVMNPWSHSPFFLDHHTPQEESAKCAKFYTTRAQRQRFICSALR